ncbi:NirD/YgiW/YdeI family stress tolerance protein [Alkanindiges illinoisensis]|uniref:NirD/YgiW/YdeI family stress tolerance protein n=1 Tax=Alkanindiges illinoisensis TaxID=197183 RepID=UPI00054F2DE2
MKYAVIAGLMSLGLATSMTYAQPVNQAALTATQIATVTVAQAKTLKDDSKVVLNGQILRAMGDEKYEFKDASGTIVVDIDDEKWNGQPVDSSVKVTLVGEVDHDRFPKKTVEVDVDEVRINP